MLTVTGYREATLLLKTVKRVLYLGYVLLRYVLIYNLEVSFNFHVTFLQLNQIKSSLCSKNCFLPYSRLFSRAPDNLNFFRFPLKVRVIGSPLYLYTVKNVMSSFNKVRSKTELRIRFQPASLTRPGGYSRIKVTGVLVGKFREHPSRLSCFIVQ